MQRWIHWGLLVILMVALAAGIRHALWAASCRVAMVEQPLPEANGWQAWPVLPELAGYAVEDLAPYRDLGWTSARPHATGDARLAGRGVCAERGASVQSWTGQYFTHVSGNDWTLRLREDPQSHTMLVTAERTRPSEERVEPRPIVAFRVEADGLVFLALRITAWPLAGFIALGRVVAKAPRSPGRPIKTRIGLPSVWFPKPAFAPI